MKQYEQPVMRVILLSHGTALLAGSAGGEAGAPEYYPDNHEE